MVTGKDVEKRSFAGFEKVQNQWLTTNFPELHDGNFLRFRNNRATKTYLERDLKIWPKYVQWLEV